MSDIKIKVLLLNHLVKKAMSPRWHSEDRPGPQIYSSEQHPVSIEYYAMHYTLCVMLYMGGRGGGVFILHQRA